MTLTVRHSHKLPILCLEYFKSANSSDVSADLLFTASEDRSVRLWDLRTGGAVRMFSSERLSGEFGSIVHGPKSATLAVADRKTVLGLKFYPRCASSI